MRYLRDTFIKTESRTEVPRGGEGGAGNGELVFNGDSFFFFLNFFVFLKKDFIYLFLDRGEGREKERET